LSYGHPSHVDRAKQKVRRQLDVVRRLKATGASGARLRAAAARLGELKRAVNLSLPRGTASRKKKRKAAYDGAATPNPVADDAEHARIEARDAAAVARYPPPDPPPLDADGFVVAFDPLPLDETLASALRRAAELQLNRPSRQALAHAFNASIAPSHYLGKN
jgi:hypothetical protein